LAWLDSGEVGVFEGDKGRLEGGEVGGGSWCVEEGGLGRMTVDWTITVEGEDLGVRHSGKRGGGYIFCGFVGGREVSLVS